MPKQTIKEFERENFSVGFVEQVDKHMENLMSEKKQLFSVIAQGPGYYGVAFFTVMSSFEEIEQKLKKAELTFQSHASTTEKAIIYTGLTIIKPFDGNAQPKPIVLFCSGHSFEDMKELNELKKILS